MAEAPLRLPPPDELGATLRDGIELFERLPDCAPLAAYLRLMDAGLRRQALSALDAFLTQADRWSPAARRHFTVWLLKARDRNPDWQQDLPRPFHDRLLDPVLAEWRR